MKITRLSRIVVLLVSASLATASMGFRPWGGGLPVDAISREFSFGAGFGSRGEAISREFSFGAGFGSRGEAISREFSFGAGFGSRGEAISREFSFAVGSDLAFTHSIPSQGLINEVFHVTWTTRNYGRSVADGPWVDRLEFSTPMLLVSGGTVTQVPLDSPDSLAPGQSYQRSLSFLMPASPTTFSARISVDVNRQVIEATDFNNTTDWLPVEVIDIYRPNLTASITMQPPTGQSPSVVRAGDSLAIEFKIVNKGNVPTPAPLWSDRIYLVQGDAGQPPTSTSGAVRSWSKASQGLLLPDPSGNGTVSGSSYVTQAIDLELPMTILGTYYLAVRADASNSQLELNENDNLVFSNPITVSPPNLPDLAVESVEAQINGSPILNGTPLQSGTTQQIGWKVRNTGTAAFPGGTVRADIWVSSDSVSSGVTALDAATNLRIAQANVQVPPLALGASADVSAQVYLPLDVAQLPGQSAAQRFKVHIDPNGQVWEVETFVSAPYWNNLGIGASSHGFNQAATPDLVAQSISKPTGQQARSGFPLTVQWNVSESGGPWDVPFAWRDELWLSPCTGAVDDPLTCNRVLGEADDILLASVARSATQQGGTWVVADYPKSTSVMLREDLSGDYRLILRTDANGNLFEGAGGESNNVAVGPVFSVSRNPADLAITAGAGTLMPDTMGAPGDVLHLSWTVSNSATGGVTSTSAWTDRVYLSNSPTSFASGQLVRSVPRTRTLAPGEQYDVVVNAAVPFVAPGQRYLHFVAADYQGVVFEDNVLNNATSTPFLVTNAVADLVVDSVSAAQVLRNTEPVVVSWTVRNAGSATTTASSWYDRVYFSDAADISQATRLHIIGYRFRGEQLNAGSTYTATASFAFPYGLTPGPWYVLVDCDAGHQVYELSDSNNDSSTPSILEIAPPAPVEPGEPGEPVPVPTSQWLPANLVTRQVHAVSATAFAGQALEVSWEVTNEGAGVGNRSFWSESVYLSLDDNLDAAQDVYLGSFTNNAFLNVGETRVRSKSFIVPLPANGAWKLIVDADSWNQVDQLGLVADDIAVSPGLVQITPPPLTNLSVIDIDLPLSPNVALLGAPLEFDWTTQNDSLADLPAALSWTDRFWLVPGVTFPAADAVLIGEIRSNAGLIAANGGTHVQSAANAGPRLLVPGVMPGDYRIAVHTDALLQIAETVESDNQFVSVGTLSLRAIDLPLGGSAQAELENGAMRWFQLAAPADKAVDLVFEHIDPSARCELFVSDGSLPVLGRYDLASEGPGAIDAFRQAVRIPRTSGNDYFILARTVSGAGRNATASIEAIGRDFALDLVEPSRVGAGVVTIALQGAELWRVARVELLDPNASAILATATGADHLRLLEDGTLLAKFDLTGVDLGAVDIAVIDGVSAQELVLSDALEIDAPLPLVMRGELALAPNIRRGETGVGELVLRNLGNLDVPFGLASIGHQRPDGAVDDAERAILMSPALSLAQIDSDGVRDGWALIVEDLAPGRTHRVPLDLMIGGDFDQYTAAFSVAVRPIDRSTYLSGPFATWSKALRLALATDPLTPGQLSVVAQSPAVWNAAVNNAIAAGDIVLEVGELHLPNSPTRSASEVVAEIAAGLSAYLALPAGVEVPSSAIAKAVESQACSAFIGLPLDCEQLFPAECGDALSTGGATTISGSAIPVGVACVSTPAPDDPNVKIKLPGVPPNATVSASQPLQYEVHFENRETATAWASSIEIVDELQPGFNAASLRFQELRIGRTVIPFPANTRSYLGQQDLQIDATTTMRVQISASVDAVTRVVRVRLQAIDPATGLPPVSGDRGLLAPSTPGSQRLASGYVKLSASVDQPVPGGFAGIQISRSGSTETNSASIQMDFSPVLSTNTVSNTLDATGPTSSLASSSMLAPNGSSYLLSWSATDVEQLESSEFPGTGIRSFTLYQGTSDDGPWTPVLADTESRSFEFVPPAGGSFWFRLEATDGVGNVGAPSDAVEVVVPFDCNGNGVPDDEEIASGAVNDCDLSGVPDSCELLNGELTDSNGNGVPDVCECLATSFCASEPNSTGQPARIEALGPASVGAGLTLRVSGLLPNRTGQFFFSQGVAFFPRGDGYQCLSSPQFPLSRVLKADAAGVVTFELDFDATHVIAGGITPGATRYFQYWYRDGALQGGAGLNSSDGLQVTFCE